MLKGNTSCLTYQTLLELPKEYTANDSCTLSYVEFKNACNDLWSKKLEQKIIPNKIYIKDKKNVMYHSRIRDHGPQTQETLRPLTV